MRSLSEKQGHEVLLSVDVNFADTGEAIDITAVPTAIEATLKQSANPNLSDGDFKTNYTIIESAELTWLSCNFCGTEASTADDMAEHIETSHNPMMNIFEMKESSGDLSSDDNLILNADVMFSSRPQIQGVKSCENPIELGGLLEGIDCYITDDPFDSSGGCIKESDFSCARCPSRFRNKRCLQDHIRRHHTDNLKCQQCATSFEDKNKLRQHNLVEHKKDCRELPPDKVICEKKCCACLKEFETDAELLSHLKNHRGLTGRLLCDHKAVVKCFDDLVAHAKYHLQPKTHECIYCNKPFPFDSKFFIHLSGHKRTDVHRKISCPKCGSKFRNARELETHDKVKHRNESLFICPFCTKSFCSKSSCESHIKFVHKNEKRFECKVCKMKFNLKSHLSRHEATHQKKRPCVCQLCGNSFKTKEGLDFHMKRHDGSMKKFGCTQCSYTFVSKNRLQVHMLTHSRTVSSSFASLAETLYFFSKFIKILLNL